MSYADWFELILILGCGGFFILLLAFQCRMILKIDNDTELLNRIYSMVSDYKIIRNIVLSFMSLLTIIFIFSHIRWA